MGSRLSSKIVVTSIRQCDISDSDDETVIDTEEDDLALTDDEKELASYLESNQQGASRNARSFISLYPPGERSQLHRYQDQADLAASKRGKITKP